MLNIKDFINENLYTIINEELESVFKRNARNAKETGQILDKIQQLCKLYSKNKDQKVSLDNKQDLRKVFKQFINSLTFGNEATNRQTVKKYGLATEEGFRSFMLGSHDELEKLKYDISWIKQFDETEMEKEFKKYKESKEYIPGTKGEDINQDDVDDRDLVVYDRWNPETFMIFTFSGKRNKNTEHQVNMHRVEFHYEYGVKYYDAYPILASNYFDHVDELKQRAEMQLGYTDPNEFK